MKCKEDLCKMILTAVDAATDGKRAVGIFECPICGKKTKAVNLRGRNYEKAET